MTRRKSAFLWMAFGFAVVVVVFIFSILRSTSSTAAIGFIFVPFYAAPFALLFFIFGYCIPDIGNWLRGKSSELTLLARLRAVFAVSLVLAVIAYTGYGFLLTNTVNQVRVLNESEIPKFLDDSPYKNNKFVLGALVLNPNTTSQVLNQIALTPNPALHRKMWSVWPLLEGNGKGLAVMRLIARNKNVSVATLVYLSKSPDEYVISDVVANPKTPVPILRTIFERGGYLIEWGLAVNPRVPVDILEKLAGSDDQYTRSSIASNKSTPVETLARLAKDPVAHVRSGVATNKRTSSETLAYLRNDPNQHIRFSVASNPHASVETLESLRNDPETRIRHRAEYTLKKKKNTGQK